MLGLKRTQSAILVLVLAIAVLGGSPSLLPKAHAYWDPACTPQRIAQLSWRVANDYLLPSPMDFVAYVVWAASFAKATGIPFQVLMANAWAVLGVSPVAVGAVAFLITTYCLIPGAV